MVPRKAKMAEAIGNGSSPFQGVTIAASGTGMTLCQESGERGD
jgi:C4-dicarboxylate transporter